MDGQGCQGSTSPPPPTLDEFTDALGNVVEVKKKTVDVNSKEAKKKAKLKAKRRARGEEVSDSEDGEWEGFGEGED